MRQLFPTHADPADLRSVYGSPPHAVGRPGVRLNMIASADGATAVSGVSGPLGGPADLEVFTVLRSVADVVLVAAGTVRAERYGPIEVPLAVVTRSCSLDWSSPLFTDPRARTIVISTPHAPVDARERAAEVADVILTEPDPAGSVDLEAAVRMLGDRGFRNVLAEGGPSLNGQLALDGLVDELCLTLSPALVAGGSKRIALAAHATQDAALTLASLCQQDDFLFLRYAAATQTAAGS